MPFAEPGSHLPLSQPTVSTLLRFRAAREVYFNSFLLGMQLHSGNRRLEEPVLPAAAGRAAGPRERCLPHGAKSLTGRGGDNCLALTVPFETELFVARHSVQGVIKRMPMNSAVWGPKVPKDHVLLERFRKSTSWNCRRKRFLMVRPVQLWRCRPSC